MYSYTIITINYSFSKINIIYLPFSFLFKMGEEKKTLKLNHQTLILNMLVLMSGKNNVLLPVYM